MITATSKRRYDGKQALLSETVVVLKLGASGAGAACRKHAGRHSAGCRIAREPLRSEDPSFSTTGLDYRDGAVISSLVNGLHCSPSFWLQQEQR
ncbi:MAG: hypothetical protein WBJ82_04035 [Tepidanaerobacteraceae bacterium]|nr:hypothetical protein [Tepidanaerobacter sp.]HQA60992.1 hypothetical protein [Tepidanaerobacteraceae bacterium]HQE04808.1 hypothetical protein [Tepidanaerobacteraceae bacterium]